ncbi:pyridoxamine 5'-phosphate oxidase family protein [Natronomonas sp.]|jgi:predicted pyridoxine 5'-phosphate oxidase superfamily flavin-nucleotide-binding protein|uniref:pyridoxamine 5'-phosphate oxidase family protein n=1 Tax=Natronomonas sp. TaxID=2184060 RepID=UPI00398A1F53
MTDDAPGSDGERDLQRQLGTENRADAFYDDSMHEALTPRMERFVGERIMFFLATADGDGHTDCSPRLGPQGFVNVIEPDRVAYPEYRGNGVHASLGNIDENPHTSLTFVDWWETTVGLHINGKATVREELPEATDPSGTDRVKCWVDIDVEEAYIHCAKHLPQLQIQSFDPPWGTDSDDEKRSGFFSE